MTNNYTVYEHIAPNGKRYIGITRLDPVRRWDYGRGYSEQVFGRAITKYGWENITSNILHDKLTRDEACRLEQYYIREFNTQDSKFGYNVSNGGETNSMTEATRHKLRLANLGKKYPEVSKKMMGHRLTEQTKKKISDTVKKRWKEGAYNPQPMTEEAKENLRKINLGKRHTQETRRKMSQARRLNPHKTRKCQCVDTGQIFNSCTNAERFINDDGKLRINIQACCSGAQKTAYGFKWRYI